MKKATRQAVPAALAQVTVITATEDMLKSMLYGECLKAVREVMFDLKQSEPVEDIIMINDAAKLLGLSIHTVHDKCWRGELPFDKKGRRLYFSRAGLLKWIKTGEK